MISKRSCKRWKKKSESASEETQAKLTMEVYIRRIVGTNTPPHSIFRKIRNDKPHINNEESI